MLWDFFSPPGGNWWGGGFIQTWTRLAVVKVSSATVHSGGGGLSRPDAGSR